MEAKFVDYANSGLEFYQSSLPTDVSMLDFKVRYGVAQSFAQGFNYRNTPVFSSGAADSDP
jgi:hypothetical protein